MPAAMEESSNRRTLLPFLLICFFFSGAAGLIYQVAWSKALGLVFGHTAYAVATVLAVFMGGLAVRQRMDWPVERTQGPAHRDLRMA